MMEDSTIHHLLRIMLDEERLQILGRLAERPQNAPQLAAHLQMKPGDVARHLKKLAASGLIQSPQPNIYRLNLDRLHQIKKGLFAATTPATPAEQALRGFIEGDRLVSIPTKPSKLGPVLTWLADKFERDMVYPEQRINQIIQHHHPDYASLRRLLVDHGFMQRERGRYWRIDPST